MLSLFIFILMSWALYDTVYVRLQIAWADFTPMESSPGRKLAYPTT